MTASVKKVVESEPFRASILRLRQEQDRESTCGRWRIEHLCLCAALLFGVSGHPAFDPLAVPANMPIRKQNVVTARMRAQEGRTASVGTP